MERINNHIYYLKIASTIAERSTCLRHHVGCLLVKDNQILSTGYNGAAKGLPHCIDTRCIRDLWNIPSGEHQEICNAIHAEQNAIINAAKYGISIKGSILYCTHKPCIICTKMLINAEIKSIFYIYEYQNNDIMELLHNAGITLYQYSLD